MYNIAHLIGLAVGVILRIYDDVIEGFRDGVSDSRDWSPEGVEIVDELHVAARNPLIDLEALARAVGKNAQNAWKRPYGPESDADGSKPAPGTTTLG